MLRHLYIPLILAGLTACTVMSDPHTADIHPDHTHVHGENCGHAKVWHVDHWDYLHDGHLHHVHGDHVDEHVMGVTALNPSSEAPLDPALHLGHMHGDGDDAHLRIRHGDHIDYIHDGHLHHVHGDHIDDHGPIIVQENG